MSRKRNRNSRSSPGLISASGAVAAWLGSQELAQALRPHMAKVHWEPVVGPQVAGVTQVEAVREGVLIVRVKNSVWATELSLLKDDIVRRLNLVLGGRVITDIRLNASGLLPRAKPPEKALVELPSEADLAQIALPAGALARIAATVQGITDEQVRERLRATLLRVARREEWKRQHGWQPCSKCATLTPPEPASKSRLCPLCRAGIQ